MATVSTQCYCQHSTHGDENALQTFEPPDLCKQVAAVHRKQDEMSQASLLKTTTADR